MLLTLSILAGFQGIDYVRLGILFRQEKSETVEISCPLSHLLYLCYSHITQTFVMQIRSFYK